MFGPLVTTAARKRLSIPRVAIRGSDIFRSLSVNIWSQPFTPIYGRNAEERIIAGTCLSSAYPVPQQDASCRKSAMVRDTRTRFFSSSSNVGVRYCRYGFRRFVDLAMGSGWLIGQPSLRPTVKFEDSDKLIHPYSVTAEIWFLKNCMRIYSRLGTKQRVRHDAQSLPKVLPRF